MSKITKIKAAQHLLRRLSMYSEQKGRAITARP